MLSKGYAFPRLANPWSLLISMSRFDCYASSEPTKRSRSSLAMIKMEGLPLLVSSCSLIVFHVSSHSRIDDMTPETGLNLKTFSTSLTFVNPDTPTVCYLDDPIVGGRKEKK